MLIDARAGESDAARCPGHARKDVGHPERSKIIVVHYSDTFARLILRIGEDLLDVVDRRNCRLGLLEGLDHRFQVMAPDPAAHYRVDGVDMFYPVKVGLKARIVCRAGASGQIQDAPHDARRCRGKRDPASVPRPIGVAWSIVHRSVAGAVLNDPQLIKDRALRTEQGEDRLVYRDVDVTARGRCPWRPVRRSRTWRQSNRNRRRRRQPARTAEASEDRPARR